MFLRRISHSLATAAFAAVFLISAPVHAAGSSGGKTPDYDVADAFVALKEWEGAIWIPTITTSDGA